MKEYAQYESIPYAQGLICPQCELSGDGYDYRSGQNYRQLLPKAKLVGWCNTPQGYMMVFECTHCFSKFRYHGLTTERWHYDEFMRELRYRKGLDDELPQGEK